MDAPRSSPAEGRTLESVESSPRTASWNVLARAAGMAVVYVLAVLVLALFPAAVIRSVLGQVASAASVVAIVVAALVPILLRLVPMVRRAMRTKLEVDESGIRVHRVSERWYIPLSQVANCAMFPWKNPFYNELQLWDEHYQVLLRVPLVDDGACKQVRKLHDMILRRRRPVPGRHLALQQSLKRANQPREVWLRSLVQSAGAGAYRGGAQGNLAGLREILHDPAYPPDTRSAAAVLLYTSGEDAERREVVAALHEGSPPGLAESIEEARRLLER